MKTWARQRQLESCNVDASTGDPAVVHFHKNNEIGHYLASSLPASSSPEFSGLLTTGVSPTILNQAVAAAQKEVDVAEVNLCMAQRLREHMASADSLFLSAADLRQLIEVIRERSQIAMMQYALLARTFTNPDDRPGGPGHAMQAFITLMHWSKLSWAPLSDMGDDLAAAVQLHVDATRELAQLLVRSASARIDRAGAPSNNPQMDFGSGSWRQRLLALLYGGNPLRVASTPGDIDLSSEQVSEAIEQAEMSVPWDAAWTEDSSPGWAFPNSVSLLVPAQRYAKTPTSDPQVKQLLALARRADALFLKERDADFVHTGVYNGVGTLTFRRIDVDESAPQVWALVEAWLRTEECKKVNPSCTFGVDDPAMPAQDAYATSLLWRRYGIQPAHAASLVSMLADVVPLRSEGNGRKWLNASLPSVPYEQVGPLHVTGASSVLDSVELDTRLPGRDTSGVWHRLAPDFNVVPFGNAERAPLYTAVGSLFVPRSFDKWNVPSAQGFGEGTAIRHMGAISALTAVRTLLEDSIAGASPSLRKTYLAKTPRALEVIDGAIGEQSLSVRPSTSLQNLYRRCDDFDPSSSTVRSCPTIIQTSSANGETARWNVSVRTQADDPFFKGTVWLVIVPFQGGIETAAALDPNYRSLGQTSAASLLATGTPGAGRLEVSLPGSGDLREATVDLPVKGDITGYYAGIPSSATFTVFLKRVESGNSEYRLLAQQLELVTSVMLRDIGDGSTQAYVGLPVDGQFIAYGGVLGDIAARAWSTRAGDWSKPAYDGFGLPADWVPPFDPNLLGTGADDASATYLRHARAAADEATNAVKSAIDELLKEQSDDAAINSARRKAAGIAQLEQRALCGDTKPDCDTSTHDFNMFAEGYVTNPTCTGRLCLGALELISAKVVPRTVRLAQAVYDRRNDQAAPPFNDYAGGTLQSALIAQWAALNKLKRLMIETSAGLVSHERQVEAADAEYDHASGQAGYECSSEVLDRAVQAGMSFPGECPNCDLVLPVSRSEGWNPGPMITQLQACDRARAAMPVADARYAAVVAQSWAWMTSQMTVLLDAGSSLQMASAELAKALQVTNLAKAQAKLEASLAFDNVQTKFGTYRRYHSYDVWRARGLLESTRRYAAAARRAIEARYVVDLSEMRSDEPFVAAPATWADEVYEYDLAAPASVGLTAIPTSGGGGGIYPNRLVDYVGNLERFVNGYAVARPTAIAQSDDEVFHVAGPDLRVGACSPAT